MRENQYLAGNFAPLDDELTAEALSFTGEIPKELDTDNRCIYFKQMEYGLYLRMALCELMFA